MPVGASRAALYSQVGDAIPDSVVNRWAFDEGSGSTAYDGVGNSDGSISGASWISDAKVGGYSLSFSSDLVSMGDLGHGSLSKWSVGFWAKPASTQSGSDWHGVVHNGDAINSQEWGIVLNSSMDAWTITHSDSYPGNGLPLTGSASYETWQFVVITDDGTTIKIYVDATEKDSANGGYVSTTDDFHVGRYLWQTGSRYFDGPVDAPFVANDALSQSQIQDLMNLTA